MEFTVVNSNITLKGSFDAGVFDREFISRSPFHLCLETSLKNSAAVLWGQYVDAALEMSNLGLDLPGG